MPGFTVDFRIKDPFLDTRKIENQANRAGLRMLGRAGGLIRKIARNSLRPRKTSAMPGQPPSVHAQSKVGQQSVTVRTKTGRPKIKKVGGRNNQATLKNILYGVDQASLSMICGPVGLNGRSAGKFTVPELMEKGGQISRQEILVGDQWQALAGRRVRRLGGSIEPTRTRTLRYAPHPFMVPARDKALESLPGLWS